ncbi:MAG: hypothetical protein AAFO06_22745 [Cyanobacteria bacterium J06597_16]
MRKKLLITGLLTAGIAPLVLIFLFFLLAVLVDFPFTSGIVARGKSSDGVEACIVQYYKNTAEPYQVSFYAKYPGEEWRRHYLAHESGRWRNATIKFESTNALIYKDKKLNRTIPIDKQSLTNEQAGALPGKWDCQQLNQAHKSER